LSIENENEVFVLSKQYFRTWNTNLCSS
jgi:hypothetical protein